jgi:Leucine-rich repeat (LRR) protein
MVYYTTFLELSKDAEKNQEELEKITELDFGTTKQRTLPESIKYCINLESIKLMYNELTELPDVFQQLTKLRELKIHNNKLRKIPESLKFCVNLEYLDCSTNELREIPDFIGELPKLTTLHYINNPLIKYPYFREKQPLFNYSSLNILSPYSTDTSSLSLNEYSSL